MRKILPHVDIPDSAEIVAYLNLTDADLVAVRTGDHEVLYLDGVRVPLPTGSHSASQLVIFAALTSKQARASMILAFRRLISAEE